MLDLLQRPSQKDIAITRSIICQSFSRCAGHTIDFSRTILPLIFARAFRTPIIQVRNGDDEIVVTQTGNYESRKSLGVHLNPAGTMKKQMEVLRSKSRKFTECLMSNVLSRREATMMYYGIYLPSTTYPMAVTHLTEDECHQIETPFLQVLIPRVVYARTMSRAIRYAPLAWGGAGFRTLYGEQTVASI